MSEDERKLSPYEEAWRSRRGKEQPPAVVDPPVDHVGRRLDGPTIEEHVEAGNAPSTYPPPGCVARESPGYAKYLEHKAEIDADYAKYLAQKAATAPTPDVRMPRPAQDEPPPVRPEPRTTSGTLPMPPAGKPPKKGT